MWLCMDQLAIVMQGPLVQASGEAALRYRLLAPRARVVVSTWPEHEEQAHQLRCAGLVDEVVINDDPGALPPTTLSASAAPNNVNRMIVSSRNGIARAQRPYVIRVRSDASLDPAATMQTWFRYSDSSNKRLLFASRYTRHPYGFNGYLFHISDWITAGDTQQCLQYWSAPLMSWEDATYFERVRIPSQRPNHRRWRARMSQEQWLAAHWAKSLGYEVIDNIAQESDELRQQYLALLANACIIADAVMLGLVTNKHANALSSPYQALDCVSHKDWLGFRRGVSRGLSRRLAHTTRDAVIRAVLMKKSLQNLLPERKCKYA